jgi:AAHS family 3-hydroxyphenylpropionic acid transporter
MADRKPATESALRVGALCFLITMFEGFDLQIMGVLAPTIRDSIEISPGELGGVFGAATLGLLAGALIAGVLADVIGRKPTLVASIVVFAVCTGATALAASPEQLMLARFATGLGLGGAMPCVAAIAAEAVGEKRSGVAFVTIMFAGMPFGGAFSSLAVALWPGEISWRDIFAWAGAAQLGLALLIWVRMPESGAFLRGRRQGLEPNLEPSAQSRQPIETTHWFAVAGLCVAFFFTLLSLHFFLNWLPSMLTAQGFSGREAAFVAFAFGLSGALASLPAAVLARRGFTRLIMFAAYAGLALASAAPSAFGTGLSGALVTAVVVGTCLIGAQMVLYGLAPGFFAAHMRGRGVGVTIASGRLGSFIGPTAAGVLLGAGWSHGEVMALNAPAAALSAFAVIAAVSLASATATKDQVELAAIRPE